MAQSMLTTIDNPFDPFTQYDEWLMFDEDNKHYSCALLARITRSSESLSPQEEADVIESAIDEIVNENVSGIHTKVTQE